MFNIEAFYIYLFENFLALVVGHFEACLAFNINHLSDSDLRVVHVKVIRRCFHFFAYDFRLAKLGTAVVGHFAAAIGPFAVFTFGLAGCERDCGEEDQDKIQMHLG